MIPEHIQKKIPQVLFWSINFLLFLGITLFLLMMDFVFSFSYFHHSSLNPVPYYLFGLTLMAFPAFFVVNFLTNRFLKVGFTNWNILTFSAVIPFLSFLIVIIF